MSTTPGVRERPILFSGPMVRAILRSHNPKTQTRRIEFGGFECFEEGWSLEGKEPRTLREDWCPYGQAGDRLWVRETWQVDAPRDGSWCDTLFYGDRISPLDWIPVRFRRPSHCLYRASWDSKTPGIRAKDMWWRPSIFTPRWASRILLEITDVRVQGVNEITIADAMAEGLSPITKDNGQTWKYGIPDRDGLPGTDDYGWPWADWSTDPRQAYRRLWDSINRKRAPWASNPTVYALTFKRLA